MMSLLCRLLFSFAGEKSKPKDLQWQNLNFCFIRSVNLFLHPACCFLSIPLPGLGAPEIRKVDLVRGSQAMFLYQMVTAAQRQSWYDCNGENKKKNRLQGDQTGQYRWLVIWYLLSLLAQLSQIRSTLKGNSTFTGKKNGIHKDTSHIVYF